MARDSDERRKESRDQRDETGAAEGRSGRSSVPAQSGEDGEGNTLQELRIAVVDELLDVGRREEHVRQQVEPDVTIQQQTPYLVRSDDGSFAVSRVGQRVDDVVRPRRQLTQSGTDIRLRTVRDVSAVSMSHQVQSSVRPGCRVEEKKNVEVRTVSDISVNRRNDRVAQGQRPSHDRQREQAMIHERDSRQAQDEIVEDDPVFDWFGGLPYGSGRPKLVLHRSQSDVETLPFLQVLLRDTYKELEGGEPGAETVEFVANEPRMPQVQKNIVTLNLTGTEWSSSMRNGEPVIERNNLDIVPKLREVAKTLYTGELGYFVVNIPDSWEGAVLQEDFFRKLVERVANSSFEADVEEGGVFEMLRSSPVVVAEPRVNSEAALVERTSQYFSIHDLDSDQNVSVEQIEATAERWLRRNDWKRIALTERQRHADESDEHFLWKAAIADGLAWYLYQQYQQEELASDEEISFEAFLQQEVIPADWFQTEHEVGDGRKSKAAVVADLLIKTESSWVRDAVAGFISDDTVDRGFDDIVVEFETGRGEGAFNFRKVRETLEKYKGADNSERQVCLVVPSRLLFRGERRARMIVNLAETWNKNPDHAVDAGVFIPVLDSGYCRALECAESVVEELYGGEPADE